MCSQLCNRTQDEESMDFCVVVIDPNGHVVDHTYAAAREEEPEDVSTEIAVMTNWLDGLKAH